MVAGRKDGERDSWESGMDTYTLLYLRWITNEDLLYSTWNSAESYEAGREGSWGRPGVCVCMAETFRCSPETATILFVSRLYPIGNKR